jgi:hypothetical protein
LFCCYHDGWWHAPQLPVKSSLGIRHQRSPRSPERFLSHRVRQCTRCSHAYRCI